MQMKLERTSYSNLDKDQFYPFYVSPASSSGGNTVTLTSPSGESVTARWVKVQYTNKYSPTYPLGLMIKNQYVFCFVRAIMETKYMKEVWFACKEHHPLLKFNMRACYAREGTEGGDVVDLKEDSNNNSLVDTIARRKLIEFAQDFVETFVK